MKQERLITLLLILISFFLGGMLFRVLSITITKEIMQNLMIVLAISFLGLGFIGFQINEKSKYFKLQKDFLMTSLILLSSIIFSLIYILEDTSLQVETVFKHLSIIFSTSGLIYFLIILIISIFWIDYLP